MADFLSAAWFEEVNESLRDAGSPPRSGDAPWRAVFEFANAPATSAHALTFTVDDAGARLERGDHLAADILIHLDFHDARDLAAGRLDSATALREGRLKVRGDLRPVVELVAWARAIHPIEG